MAELRVSDRSRKSYAREVKLEVVNFYESNGRNLCQTSKHFSVHTKTVKRWILNKDKIRQSRKGSKRIKFARTPKFPVMEQKLYDDDTMECRQLAVLS